MPLLWHYTSLDSALKIVEHEKVFATAIDHLNDAAEVKEAAAVFERMLGEQAKSDPDRWKKHVDYLIRFANLSRHPEGQAFDIDETGQICVFCLSGTGDSLSQWRSYSPREGGVALGFGSEAMGDWRHQASDSTATLTECLYTDAEHRTALDPLFAKLVVELQGNPSVSVDRIFFLKNFHEIAPTIKHRAFADENEWRLVTPFVAPHDLKIRESRHRAVPYVSLAPPKRLGHCLVEVRVGPGPNMELSYRALSMALGGPPYRVTRSDIPYRAV